MSKPLIDNKHFLFLLYLGCKFDWKPNQYVNFMMRSYEQMLEMGAEPEWIMEYKKYQALQDAESDKRKAEDISLLVRGIMPVYYHNADTRPSRMQRVMTRILFGSTWVKH